MTAKCGPLKTGQTGCRGWSKLLRPFIHDNKSWHFAQSIWNKFKSIINPIYYCITTPLRPTLDRAAPDRLWIDTGSLLSARLSSNWSRHIFYERDALKSFPCWHLSIASSGHSVPDGVTSRSTKYWICWSSSKNTHVRDRVERGNLNREFGTRSNFSNYLLKYQRKRNEKQQEGAKLDLDTTREVEAESSEVKVELVVQDKEEVVGQNERLELQCNFITQQRAIMWRQYIQKQWLCIAKHPSIVTLKV